MKSLCNEPPFGARSCWLASTVSEGDCWLQGPPLTSSADKSSSERFPKRNLLLFVSNSTPMDSFWGKVWWASGTWPEKRQKKSEEKSSFLHHIARTQSSNIDGPDDVNCHGVSSCLFLAHSHTGQGRNLHSLPAAVAPENMDCEEHDVHFLSVPANAKTKIA